MAQIINTNIASLNAQRNLNNSQSANSTALERLSSGLRINSAKDDAAGLAISTKFESQTRGLNQAIRNAGDGISLAQTAEGALGSMTDNLQRVRELAVQSANATNSDEDRAALQQEVSALVAEITRTADETDFNGRTLFDGNFNGTFQIGANAGQTVDVKIGELTADKLGVSDTAGVSAFGTDSALQNGDLIINGVSIAPSQGSSDTASIVNQGASAIAKVEAINAQSEQTGVSAKVNTNVAAGTEMTAGAVSGIVEVNGVAISVATGGQNLDADRDSVISAINAKSAQTGVVAQDGGDSGGVILEAADGRNITVEFSGFGGATDSDVAAATGVNGGTGVNAVTSYGGFTLVSESGQDIDIQGGQGTGTGDITNSGLTAGVYSGREAALATTNRSAAIQTQETNATFTTGDLGIVADTAVNATNNSFDLSVDGADFATLTLSSTYDAGSGAGEYDNAAQLADAINNAIENDANFYDVVDGTNVPKLEASDDGNGGITFTTTSTGEDASVIARRGEGNIAIPTAVEVSAGSAAAVFTGETIADLNFSNANTITVAGGNGTLSVTDGAGTTADVTVADGTYTGEQFVAALQTAMDGVVDATAVLSDDGSTVSVVAGTDGNTASVAASAATQMTVNPYQAYTSELDNGDVVITDVAAFLADYTAGTANTLGIAVDGQAAQDLALDESTADYVTYGGPTPPANADDLTALINSSAEAAIAGTGITATNVGGQIVISSDDPNGTIDLSQATANPLGGAATNVGATAGSATVVNEPAASATATTGSFNVSDGTDGFTAGTFLSSDPDGAGTTFEAQASPLVITAGDNDTFAINVDGTGNTNITIAADSYATMADFQTAVQDALDVQYTSSEVSVAVDADDPSKLVFTSNNVTPENGSIALTDGGTAGTEGAFAISGAALDGELVTETVVPNRLASGDLVLNGTSIRGSAASDDTASDTTAETSDSAASGIAIAAAINDASDKTGVTATVNATTLVGGDSSISSFADTGSTGFVYVNNVRTGSITITGDQDGDRAAAIDSINSVSGQTGVTAEDNGESITLTAADGRNVSVAIDTNLAANAAAGFDSADFGNSIGLSGSLPGVGSADITGSGSTYANTAGTTYSTLTLTSANEITVAVGENGADEVEALGLKLGTYGGGENGQFLKDVDISTFEGAQSAITAIDNALQTVASQRAELGALQNRFESTVSNLAITAENLTAANSRIRDADFAAETAELSRTQVLQQAGISILAQANQRPQQVLSLLG